MSIMNDGADQSSIPDSMDVFDHFFPDGFQQYTDDDVLLDGLSDILTSPSSNNGLTNYDEMNDMEEKSTEVAAIQIYPEHSQNLALWSPSSEPMFSAVPPMPPQAHAVHVVSPDCGFHQSERIYYSLAENEPMRVDSEDVRGTPMAEPNALGESLGSVELNATTTASIQSNDHSHGPSATQRQALPDSGRTQSTSGTTANGTTAEAGGYFSGYELPEFHHFKVSVKFMSKTVLTKDVTERGGCLLHHQPSDQSPVTVPAEVDRIPIPLKEEFKWEKDKQKRFTELIMKGFHRGVEFYSREKNIYARRRSDTKLFWHSNEQKPGLAKELKRYEETEVFNWEKFRETFEARLGLENRTNLRLPSIWFSFAQKWDRESSPITTKLVWARVDPTRACEMVENVTPDGRSTQSLESVHTSHFLFSNEASHSVPQ
ncbi:uncharacterized protein LOC100891319 [Strongylocentrotus purpuratus]|uniref:Interferon regulatory factor-3 domain-containing protein n=1 Tax=Strongylocentrotus purpuratus TaxID=7668 RepID=A0A7M7GKX9_STRPU|nr:uncharacterized protein LOC100891319 [Strongylocentrotus purpuratus]|eukprot:XP_003726606.2 PREDICTED: uncharacterized protein LOC100891319 [Strongylocentrotus purpuratus]